MVNIEYYKLENGLRIVLDEIPYVRSVAFGVWINVGSRMEDNENSGIAHFIEHMLFKGTINRTAKKISNDIDFYGGNINAFTSHDNTCYHVKMPSNHIDRGIEVLADMVKNSVFSDTEIEKEKSVIIEEIKMYEDSPEDYVYEGLLKRIYDGKGIGRNVLGNIESISKITRYKVLDFFNRNYVANNSVIVVSGNFDKTYIIEKISENFSNWRTTEVKSRREFSDFREVRYIENRDDEQSNIAIVFECPDDRNYMDYLSVKLLGNILGNSPSSRLFQKIREDKGLAYSIYSSDNFYEGCAEFSIFSSMASENLMEVYNLILDEIRDLKENYISDYELLFAKEQYKGAVIMNIEDTEDKMIYIGEYEVNDKRIREIDDVLSYIDKIDLDYMKGVIDRIFNGKMSIGITGRNVESIMS